MAKYEVEVGSLVTRLVTRKIKISAKSEEEAKAKAIDKYIDLELKVPSSVDAGSPRVDFINEVR